MDKTQIYLIISICVNILLGVVIFFKTALNNLLFEKIKENKEKKKAKVDHDKNKFQEIEKILPEDKLREWLDYFENIAPVPRIFSKSLFFLQEYHKNIYGIFMNKKIQEQFNIFISKAAILAKFLGDHYWVIKGNTDLIKMYPDDEAYSPEYISLRYIEAKKKAPIIAKEFLESYCNFRFKIKKMLLI